MTIPRIAIFTTIPDGHERKQGFRSGNKVRRKLKRKQRDQSQNKRILDIGWTRKNATWVEKLQQLMEEPEHLIQKNAQTIVHFMEIRQMLRNK